MSVPLWLLPFAWAALVYLLIGASAAWRRRLARERRAGRRQALAWMEGRE